MNKMNVDQISGVGLDSHPLFTGPVSIQRLLTDERAKQLGMLMVRFGKGVRNKFHSHTTDQVLFVTSGRASWPRNANKWRSARETSFTSRQGKSTGTGPRRVPKCPIWRSRRRVES